MRLAVCSLVLTTALSSAFGHELKDYVSERDPAYKTLEVELREETPEVKRWHIKFNSLAWRTIQEVNRPIWTHELVVLEPKTIETDQSFFFITGGSHKEESDLFQTQLLERLAINTSSIVSELRMIPNQPIEFFNDGVGRTEDDLLAYSWTQYLEHWDPTWIAHFPMTKAAVTAMDLVENFASNKAGTTINGFVVSGASKRGWTTWLTAMVDPRVTGIVPIVIDVLNARVSMNHHRESLGFWSEAVQDYVNHGILDRLNTPEVGRLLQLIDPYQHLDKLSMPKLILNAANDQFFLPDSSLFYYSELRGINYLRYVPNSGHAIIQPDVENSITAFYKSVINRTTLPQPRWAYRGETGLILESTEKPSAITLYEAVNPENRDFRLMNRNFPRYKPTQIPVIGKSYLIEVDRPSQGYKSWLVEVVYGKGESAYKLTTSARVIGAAQP